MLFDFPDSPVVKDLPCNAGDMGLIPSQGIKIPHISGQASRRPTTKESTHRNERSFMLQLRPEAAKLKKKTTTNIMTVYPSLSIVATCAGQAL